jgi:uncharacterized membrane protein
MSDPSPRRGAGTILIVSLCFNFFLAGIVVLGTLRAIQRAHAAVPVRQLLMPQAVKLLLPGDEQGKLDAIIAAHKEALDRYRDAAVETRAIAFREYESKEFDAAKFSADLEAIHSANSALEEEALKSMSETAAKLTPQERQKVADHLKHELWAAHWKEGRPGEQ